MRIVFMGTPDLAATVFDRLVDSEHEVVSVCCQPDKPKGRRREPVPPPVKHHAEACHIPVYQPRSLRRKAQVRLAGLEPDVMVVAAYGRILPQSILDIPRYGCLNVHASLLPRYRGAAPIQWAIARGEGESGITIMQMDAGLDTGDILTQRAVPITGTTTAEELHDTLAAVGAELLVETLPLVAAGQLQPRPQEEAEATWAPILSRDDGRIDWSWSGRTIDCRVRGFHPWPGTHCLLREHQFKIYPHVRVLPGAGTGEAPGTLLAVDREGLTVRCGDGAVVLTDVQLQGKKRMPAHQFASGARLAIGERLS